MLVITAGKCICYTNGIYYSQFDTPENKRPEIGFLAQAMRWSLSGRDSTADEFSIKTIGQSMVTPDDITLEDPPRPPDDLPYGGLLFYSDNWIKAYAQHAERIGVTIGIVGEYSFAEESQKLVHKITGSDEPEGWDTQLNDEIVFQFTALRCGEAGRPITATPIYCWVAKRHWERFPARSALRSCIVMVES